MSRNQQARFTDVGERRLRPVSSRPREDTRPVVVRQGGGWQTIAVLLLCIVLLGVIVLGHLAFSRLEARNQETAAAMARASRKIQHLEASLEFDSTRRQMLLGIRNQILKVNPRVSLGDAYHYAELVLEASETYPALDPLLLLAVGVVESGYDPRARSRADARGLYQIWPSTGRVLVRALGMNYDDEILYDPKVNTRAAALYLDVLFATYDDPELVLAEYNGGPVNAGRYRRSAASLAPETRNYVPRVLELYARFKEDFETGIDVRAEPSPGDDRRQGKKLGSTRP